MTTEEQISALVDLVGALQKAVLAQQTSINDLSNHSSRTIEVVNKNAQQALKNDQALMDRLKNAEAVINGILTRERRDTIENIGKSE